jgi:hypothetical protein
MVIRAHYDGKVIVPDEPVDLPVNEPLEFDYRPVERRQADAEAAWQRMISQPVFGLNIPDEALRRESLYEERV